MAKVMVRIELPDELLERAGGMDILDPESLSLLVRYELENYLSEDECGIALPPEYEEWMSRISDDIDGDVFDDVFSTELARSFSASVPKA